MKTQPPRRRSFRTRKIVSSFQIVVVVVVVVVVCYENTGAGYGSLFLRARWVRQRGLCANSEPCDGYSTSSMLSTMRLSDVTRRILP